LGIDWEGIVSLWIRTFLSSDTSETLPALFLRNYAASSLNKESEIKETKMLITPDRDNRESYNTWLYTLLPKLKLYQRTIIKCEIMIKTKQTLIRNFAKVNNEIRQKNYYQTFSSGCEIMSK
jgi:hypothetical protein